MKKLLFLICLCAFIGCESIQPKPPTVEIEVKETIDEMLSVKVVYTFPYGENVWCEFHTVEEVEKYKKEVDFLLLKLQEAEEKMQSRQTGKVIHE